jgi:DNA N-6-adenine-methyltransferase Dam
MSDHNFNTPPELLDRIRQLSPDGIGLDPCSNATSLVRAAYEWDGNPTDGLSQSWRGYGLVFMNPPHSMSPHNIEPWMEKAFTEFALDRPWTSADQFVGLVPAKTDTAWFHDYAVHFHLRCFLRRRPKFWQGGKPTPGPGKFASMLLYHGNRAEQFLQLFGDMGWFA